MMVSLLINICITRPQLVLYCDVIMGLVAFQITSPTIVYSTVYSDADQRKHHSFTSLAFVQGIHRGPVNSPHKWQVTWKMFPFDDVIMWWAHKWNLAKCLYAIDLENNDPIRNFAHATTANHYCTNKSNITGLAWISKHTNSFMYDLITHPYPYLTGDFE